MKKRNIFLLVSMTLCVVSCFAIPVAAWDTDVPFFYRVSDSEFYAGDAGRHINWTIYDSNVVGGSRYDVYRNGTAVQASSDWVDSTVVIVPVVCPTAGWLNYTIVASDGHGKSGFDTVMIFVDTHTQTEDPATPFGTPAMIVTILAVAATALILLKGRRMRIE
jgi:hypothetical protein